jgi:plastocyanin
MVLVMKRLSTIALITGFVGVCVAVIYGTIYLANKYLDAPTPSDTAQCEQTRTKHTIEIKNNAMVPRHIDASRCDTLTITNDDAAIRLIAFGQHDDHIPYNGVSEQKLKTGESFTVTLNKTGTYQFHDHIEDLASGDFTVK